VSQEKGYKFEKFVEASLTGRVSRLKRNHIVKRKGRQYQFDVTYGSMITKVIECKYRERSFIDITELGEFHAKLVSLGINPKDGYLVTNSEFSKRAIHFARKVKLNLLNGEELLRFDNARYLPFSSKRKFSLEQRIMRC
jgi:hypothetical protein